jgi:hypothetical protein
MTDVIDFEDKRKKKLGNQTETETEGFDGQSEGTLISDDDLQENID